MPPLRSTLIAIRRAPHVPFALARPPVRAYCALRALCVLSAFRHLSPRSAVSFNIDRNTRHHLTAATPNFTPEVGCGQECSQSLGTVEETQVGAVARACTDYMDESDAKWLTKNNTKFADAKVRGAKPKAPPTAITADKFELVTGILERHTDK
ncbi:hypothetical protein FRC09_009390 [Ceratobasidium sp. 395]|nr:hypothetical protein FRC09_009390 [Ceratobasidium sp. 395]